jgi:hypothetical protein
VAGVTAFVLVVLFESALPGKERLLTGDSHRPAASAPSTRVAPDNPGSGEVDRLTDDELLALFPNRPVALIGPAGRQKLVFLDQLRASPHN